MKETSMRQKPECVYLLFSAYASALKRQEKNGIVSRLINAG